MFFLLIGYSKFSLSETNTRVLLCKKYVFFYFAMMMQFLFSRTFSLRFSIATVTEAEAGERARRRERESPSARNEKNLIDRHLCVYR